MGALSPRALPCVEEHSLRRFRAAAEVRGGGVERVEGGGDEWMSLAGREQRVDVARGGGAGYRSEGKVFEGLGEELGGEGDGESAADEGADGELVVGDGDEVGREAGGLAGAGDEAVGGGGGPVVVAEVGEPDLRSLGERMVGGERDHEPFLQEVAAFEPGRVLAGEGAVLEVEGEVQVAGADARREVVAAFVDADFGVRIALAEACDGGGYEPGERGGEGADAQS